MSNYRIIAATLLSINTKIVDAAVLQLLLVVLP